MSAGQPPNFNPSCMLLIDFHFHIHFRILNSNKQWTIIYLFYFDVSVFVLLIAHNSIVNISAKIHLFSTIFIYVPSVFVGSWTACSSFNLFEKYFRFFLIFSVFCSFILIFWFIIFRSHIGGRMIKLKLPTKYVLKYMMCLYVCL